MVVGKCQPALIAKEIMARHLQFLAAGTDADKVTAQKLAKKRTEKTIFHMSA